MKKNTPYTCQTKKLMLASLISVAVTNHVQAQDLDYSNQTYPDMTVISVSGDLNFTADNSQFIRGLSVTASDNLVAELNGTTISDEVGYNNARINLAATNGDLTLTLNNYDVLPANMNPGVGLRIDAYNGDVNVDMNNNQNPRGFNIYGGNASIKVTDTLLGATGQVSPTGIIAEVGALFTGGAAQLDITNSPVLGNISVITYYNGDTTLNLNEGTVMNGNAIMTGVNNSVNIDGATLSGNISVGSAASTTGEKAGDTVNSTVNITNSVYRGNITSTNKLADDSLTLNVNNGGIVGGEAVNSAQKITGFNRVSANINYVDPSLVNTGKASYFFFNEGEQVTIANSIDGRYIADTVRTGSYVLDRIGYKVTDESAAQGLADTGYYSIVFDANEMPPTPPKPPLPPLPPEPTPDPDPTPDPTPDPVPDPEPAPAPTPAPRIAADLQAAQAGLLASDDMIHRISGSITQHLDARHMGENSAQTADSNVWIDGIYSGGDHTAGTTEYSNDITGFQLGGDTAFLLSNGDTVAVGAGLGYLHNDLDVTSSDGSNDIDGNYYSLYAGWTQHQAEGQNWHLFADATATYGDMSYSASGKDGTLNAGGDYDGNSWLWQARVGAQMNLAQDWWVQPYTVLGYSQTETDAYSDGYSHVADGKFSAGFAGAGVKAGKNITLKGGQVLRPYIETSYVGRFSEDTKFNTSDYNFGGQNLNGGSIGAGLNAQLSKNWSTTAKVNTLVASDVSNEVHAYLGAEFKF